MTTDQKTALLWALALLVWVLAFAGLVAMLGRADGLAVATRLLLIPSTSSPTTVRPVEYRDAVRSVGPLVFSPKLLLADHASPVRARQGSPRDARASVFAGVWLSAHFTQERPAAPLSGRRSEVMRIE